MGECQVARQDAAFKWDFHAFNRAWRMLYLLFVSSYHARVVVLVKIIGLEDGPARSGIE